MNLKPKFVIILLLLIAISQLTACSTNSHEAKIGDAIIKSMNYETYQSETYLKFKITPRDTMLTEEEKLSTDIINKTTIFTKSSYDIKHQRSINDMSINIDGIIFPARFYVDSNNMWLKVPLQDKYIYLIDDSDEITLSKWNEYNEFIKMLKDFIPVYIKDFNVSLEDINSTGHEVITTPEGRIKTSKITINIDDKEFKKLFIYAVNHLFSKPEFFILLNKMSDQAVTKDIENVNENIKEFENSINKLNILEDKSINITFGLDTMNNIRSISANIPLSIRDNPVTEKLNIELNIENIFYNINKASNVTLPSFGKHNTIIMEDLLNSFDNNLPESQIQVN